MKKLLLMVVVCMLTISLAACGGTTTSQKESADTNFEEKIFVDDENCTFKISGIDPDGFMGYTLKADLENKTDEALMFSFNDVSVNGYMCDPFWASSVEPGKKSKSDISFFSSDFEELGISEVEEIEFTLRIYSEDDWDKPAYVEKTFTYKLPQ